MKRLSVLCLLIVLAVPLCPSRVAPSTVDMTPVIEAIERAWTDIYHQLEELRRIEREAINGQG